jgi:translocation and assembly module TamA
MSGRAALGAALLVAAGLAGTPAGAEDALPGVAEPAEAGAEAPVVRYVTSFQGIEGTELAGLIEENSAALADQDRPPPNDLALRRRATRDVETLLRVLRSQGHYRGTVSWALFPAAEAGGAKRLVFTIVPGPRYLLRSIRIDRLDGEPPPELPSPRRLGLREGAPATAQSILDAEAELLRQVRSQGYALATIGPREAIVDHEPARMDLVLSIRPGPLASFGEVRIEGSPGVDPGFIRNRLTFAPGQRFDPALTDSSRRELLDTRLFSSVVLKPGEALDPDGRLPIDLVLSERPHRSIGGSVFVRTDEGLSISGFWEHRNLWGAGELLRVDATLGRTVSAIGARLRLPDLPDPRTALILSARLSDEDTNAYQSRSIALQGGFERRLDERTVVTVGLAYRFAEIEDAAKKDTYGLVSVPATLDWNGSDDLLDPTRGGRLLLQGQPFFDTLGAGQSFLKLRATYSHYWQIARSPTVVLALRGSVGSILGASSGGLPPDERFYAGGGGSVRGIAYQLASPLDAEGDPTGGRSVLELSGELRWRVSETIGLVAFLDGGGAFESTAPELGGDEFRLGAGLGLRYYTAIGPLRLDIAMPLEQRSIDDAFQVYASVGQAF